MLLHFYFSYIQPHLILVEKNTNTKVSQSGRGNKNSLKNKKKKFMLIVG